ncbi:MAG: metallophosphoesterase, partial [bacterium]|nr:metallophosphoesterase [bacterium]
AVTSTLVDGRTYRGEVTIDVTATDAGSGVASTAMTLDGEPIEVPTTLSTLDMTPGHHELTVQARDAVGHESTTTFTFLTADEYPGVTLDSPDDGAEVAQDEVVLRATVTSPEGDPLDVDFREGYRYTPQDPAVSTFSGAVHASSDTARADATPLTEEQLANLVTVDGVSVETTSDTALPYQLFTVAVPADAGAGSSVRATWSGSANEEARVTLYALTSDESWVQVDQFVTMDQTDFELGGTVPVEGFATEGEVTFLVQHTEGFAGEQLSTRTGGSAQARVASDPFHPDAVARSEYDFTLAWESDTQYYNRNQGVRAGTGGDDTYYQHQVAIHEFLLAQRANLNLQYLMHTGDIVDGAGEPHQWLNADDAYRMLDEAGLPYGVLAGNHDVFGAAADYSRYGEYFGDHRFAENPWFGGSYKNNRGHFDLISAGGVDLLVIYMGWPDSIEKVELNSEDIAWMNSVIRQYPERHVWINLHEYMLTTGGLGPFPLRIYNEVVAPNPNVFAVGSGHYHDAYTRLDSFDDDGDGTPDRTVTSMLFDYQGLPEGGQGFIRLLHFDNQGERILVRTYSPSLQVFNSPEASLNTPPGMQEFEVPYSAGGVTARQKVLTADAFVAEVLTLNEIRAVTEVPSGSEVSVTWEGAPLGERGWYVSVRTPFGGEAISPVSLVTVTEATTEEP